MVDEKSLSQFTQTILHLLCNEENRTNSVVEPSLLRFRTLISHYSHDTRNQESKKNLSMCTTFFNYTYTCTHYIKEQDYIYSTVDGALPRLNNNEVCKTKGSSGHKRVNNPLDQLHTWILIQD